MKAEKGFFGYKAAVGAFLVIFVNLGVCSTLGIFLPALSEYSGWSIGLLGYNGTFNTIGNIILSLICVKALSKIGPRKMMLISILCCAVHAMMYTFATPGQNTGSLILIYAAGLMASFAISFGTHAVCSYVISMWFIEKREKISGLVLSGSGFGAALWVFIAGQLFSVMDYKGSYRVLAICTLAIGLFAVLFLIKDPEKMGQKPLGYGSINESTSAAAAELPGVTRKEAIKTPAFWLLVGALLLAGMEGSAFMVYAPSWWQANGLTATQSANWNAIYLIVAGLVLLGAGSIFTKIGPTVFSVIICGGFSVCMVTLVLFGATPTTTMMLLTVIFGAIAYPINASIPSLIGQSVFGPKEFGAISATLMTGVYLGQFLYAPVMSIFLASEGGLASGWKFLCGTGIATMLLLVACVAASPMKKAVKQTVS